MPSQAHLWRFDTQTYLWLPKGNLRRLCYRQHYNLKGEEDVGACQNEKPPRSKDDNAAWQSHIVTRHGHHVGRRRGLNSLLWDFLQTMHWWLHQWNIEVLKGARRFEIAPWLYELKVLRSIPLNDVADSTTSRAARDSQLHLNLVQPAFKWARAAAHLLQMHSLVPVVLHVGRAVTTKTDLFPQVTTKQTEST